MKLFKSLDVDLWSVGFERNVYWQRLDASHILPIPYVVRQKSKEDAKYFDAPRRKDSVFYVGDSRPNAIEWGGCDRNKMLKPLEDESNMFVRVIKKRKARLTQLEYRKYMHESEYCLIVCGDTPSCRSLATAMISGCIPIRIGSRLRGLCEPPCVQKWGWTASGLDYPHLPYSNQIDWNEFPEVDESNFTENGNETLNELFRNNDEHSKNTMRKIMNDVSEGWLYGWGDPVLSDEFGSAYEFILDSFEAALFQENAIAVRYEEARKKR